MQMRKMYSGGSGRARGMGAGLQAPTRRLHPSLCYKLVYRATIWRPLGRNFTVHSGASLGPGRRQMLGPPKLRALDEPVTVSLEELVPTHHFYRHLDAALDLAFVREWVADCYAERGRPSIDPVIFFKLQLIMFFEDLRSERRLIETASLHLAHRWYLGYGLDEPLPDHSSLTRIRQRLGLAIFQRFFEHVVDLCRQAGLVWGRELFFDATKIRANAALNSVVPRFYIQAKEQAHEHLAALFADEP